MANLLWVFCENWQRCDDGGYTCSGVFDISVGRWQPTFLTRWQHHEYVRHRYHRRLLAHRPGSSHVATPPRPDVTWEARYLSACEQSTEVIITHDVSYDGGSELDLEQYEEEGVCRVTHKGPISLTTFSQFKFDGNLFSFIKIRTKWSHEFLHISQHCAAMACAQT